MTDKVNQIKFFKETFLVANVSSEVIPEMLFLTLSDANVDFSVQELRWKTYTIEEAFLTTRHVKLIEKKEFVAIVLDSEYETFVVYIAFPSFSPLIASFNSIPFDIDVHPFRRTQLSGLIVKKASTKISTEYLDFTDIFFLDLVFKFLEYTGINNHAIKLVEAQ